MVEVIGATVAVWRNHLRFPHRHAFRLSNSHLVPLAVAVFQFARLQSLQVQTKSLPNERRSIQVPSGATLSAALSSFESSTT